MGENRRQKRLLDWTKILIFEVVGIITVLFCLGLVKLPRFLMRRRLSPRFPWGYYADQVPQEDLGYFGDQKDFMHDQATEFGGLDVFGDYGEFSGFGELGEYGSEFFGDAGG